MIHHILRAPALASSGPLQFAPKNGTFVPEMGTVSPDLLSAALFPKTRRAILGLLFAQPDRAFYLREIAEFAGVGMSQVQRELERLTHSGVIRRFERGRHVYFQADENCPIYDELRSLVTKTFGVTEVLRRALLEFSERIAVAFIYGSVARRDERYDSDLDLLVVGDVGFGEIVDALSDAESRLRREISVTVYPAGELKRKLAARHHFLTSVINREKIFVIGDEHEFDALLE